VWTDDDAWKLRRIGRMAVPFLVVAPPPHVGLCPKHLRAIDDFLTKHRGPFPGIGV
jgi:hypothetical protein